MPVIKSGQLVDDAWNFVDDESEIGPGGHVTVSLRRFLVERQDILVRNEAVGVRLTPEDDPADLADHLEQIDLIEVEFPKYTDGRGYSIAQLLRRRYRYTGELRAVGHVLRDQILYMNRSGFDAFETERADLPEVMEALGEYEAFYQPAADEARSVFARRHQRSD